jgi:hypothetical protein
MSESTPQFLVQSIQLVKFEFDLDFKFDSNVGLNFNMNVVLFVNDLTKVTIDAEIKYFVNGNDRPVLTAIGRTAYLLSGMSTSINELNGNPSVDVPDEILERMNYEAVIHTRAFIAQHIAHTPFDGAHINLPTPNGLFSKIDK